MSHTNETKSPVKDNNDNLIIPSAKDSDDTPAEFAEPKGQLELMRMFFLLLLVFSLLVIAWLLNNFFGFAVDSGI